MRIKRTDRGFASGDFDDYYGKKCSIQKSSLADVEAIWFGVDNTGPHLGHADDGSPLPNQDVVNGRMHLTKAQVKSLLPILNKFAKTGELK